jgi:RNA polymerase sigma-70 factor (ECF subfamily)
MPIRTGTTVESTEHGAPRTGLVRQPVRGMLARMESDEQLMLRYQAGDADAFDTLYVKYRGDVYRFLLRQFEAAIAEELYQDIWMRLIQSRRRYAATASFRTYLYTIAHNRVRDYRRRHRHAGAQTWKDSGDCDPPDPVDPERLHHDRQALAVLLEGIHRLPAEQQQVFLLKTQSGLSVDEIAEVMHASRESTRSRLRYANRKLREHLRGIWP